MATDSDDQSSVVLTDGARSEELQCNWRSWRVIGPRTLAVDLPTPAVPATSGLLSVAQVLMPQVREVRVYVDGSATRTHSRVGSVWQEFDV